LHQHALTFRVRLSILRCQLKDPNEDDWKEDHDKYRGGDLDYGDDDHNEYRDGNLDYGDLNHRDEHHDDGLKNQDEETKSSDPQDKYIFTWQPLSYSLAKCIKCSWIGIYDLVVNKGQFISVQREDLWMLVDVPLDISTPSISWWVVGKVAVERVQLD